MNCGIRGELRYMGLKSLNFVVIVITKFVVKLAKKECPFAQGDKKYIFVCLNFLSLGC